MNRELWGFGCAIALTLGIGGLMTPKANANPSTNPQQPTAIESATYAGSLVPNQPPTKYYLTFMAGAGKLQINTKISPKDNKGAVFFWNLHPATDLSQTLCNDNLYLETNKSSSCSFGTATKPQPVILEIGAYPNSTPVPLNYSLTLSGDWKPIGKMFVKPLSVNLPSPDANKPTPFPLSGEYKGTFAIDPQQKDPTYYLAFLAGVGDFKLDVSLSNPKAAFDGAVFAVSGNCFVRLYKGKTAGSTTCSLPQQKLVKLAFNVYTKEKNLVATDVKIRVSGKWQPLPFYLKLSH